MNTLFKIIGDLMQVVVVLLFVALLIPVALGFLVFVMPFFAYQRWADRRVEKAFLKQYDQVLFMVITQGVRKRKLLEEQVIPYLPAGLQVTTFNGSAFEGIIDQKVAPFLKIPFQEGFPMVGRIDKKASS